MWGCIAEQVALPWQEVESIFWQAHKEWPDLLEQTVPKLRVEPLKQRVGRKTARLHKGSPDSYTLPKKRVEPRKHSVLDDGPIRVKKNKHAMPWSWERAQFVGLDDSSQAESEFERSESCC